MKRGLEQVRFDERGLVPVIVQDARTREVLTLAYMNEESLEKTLETKETWFWSRSRSSLWHKGETSGHTQRIRDVLVDCDQDALVVLVEPSGPACHTGARSCFFEELEGAGDAESMEDSKDSGAVLQQLYLLIESRRLERPEGSYTTYLFDQGLDKILKKVGEESSETIIAAKNDDPVALTREACDLLYHLIVLLVERGVTLKQVSYELAERRGKGK
jgi:phosphoribosyl-ATP pyrophosphohydrolase/phosphoribosyl-AMP cyclohydrolase